MVILEELTAAKKNVPKEGVWKGFNALTNRIMDDLREAGIIDPLKVTKMAFTNAVSVAANYLTIGAAVTNIPEKKDGAAGMPGMGGGMGMGDY